MAASLIEAFKAAFEGQFSGSGGTIPGGLLTEELPRQAPVPNAALTEFTQDAPKSPEDNVYTLTLAVRANKAADAWNLAKSVVAFVHDNPARPQLTWTANGIVETESGNLPYPMELHREMRVASAAGQWIWRCDVAFTFYSIHA